MIIVRVVAVLMAVALVLAIAGVVTRERRYLKWAWRTFLAALFCALGLMAFYFVERVFFEG